MRIINLLTACKQKIAVNIFLLAVVLMYPYSRVAAVADEDLSIGKMQNTTEYSYHAGPGDSRETGFALATFGAKRQAVLLSAGYLAKKGLLSEFKDKEMAVFCLVAEEMQFSIIGESFSKANNSYTTKIKSTLSLSDFVKAEIKNSALEQKDTHLSLTEEMDPVVSLPITPARELSKAYRYLGRQHWRMAVIYLDHLEIKYPYWGDLFLAKALGFQGMHETERVKEALSSACRYGNDEACLKFEALK